MLRHLAGTIILILFGISCAEQRSWTEVTFEHDSYIKVPLTINGDVHWYIFDTGAGVSTILSELAVKYNLRNEREEELAEKIEQGIKKKDSIGRFSVPAVLVPFCIGEKDFSKIDSSKVTNIFAVGELKHYGVSGKNLSGAVIGRTLINQYNWLFNFRTNKLLIADYDVDIPLSLGASCLEMRIDCGGNNMCADVLINDTMPMRFILDFEAQSAILFLHHLPVQRCSTIHFSYTALVPQLFPAHLNFHQRQLLLLLSDPFHLAAFQSYEAHSYIRCGFLQHLPQDMLCHLHPKTDTDQSSLHPDEY